MNMDISNEMCYETEDRHPLQNFLKFPFREKI